MTFKKKKKKLPASSFCLFRPFVKKDEFLFSPFGARVFLPFWKIELPTNYDDD